MATKFDPILGKLRESDAGAPGVVQAVVSGTGTTVDATDPANPIVNLSNMTTKTYKGRTAGTTGVPQDVAVATLKTDLALVKGDVGLGNVANADTTTTANITDSTDKRFVTDAEEEVLDNTSGTNTGDQINISGNAATVTTNANLTGPVTSSGNATAIANSINLPANPTTTTQTPADNSTKIATTAYVDAAVLGQNFKEAVRVATTANLVGLYANGSSGVGATFTYTASGTDNIDGVNLVLNDRVLVKNQTIDYQNGIYKVTTAGALGIAGILTRSTDANQATEYETGDSVFVTAGTTLGTTTWAYTGADSPAIGSDSLTSVQTAGQGAFTAGNGITITGTSIAINTAVTVDKTTAQVLTNKDLSSGTNTFPTLNQSTTGSAAKWTTPRLLANNSIDGSADVAFANKFIAQGTADTGLSAAQFTGALATGIVKNTTTTGVLSIAANSDLPAMSATVGGAVPTPPNNTTTYLRGDGTFAAVVAPALNIDNLTASANQTVTAGYSAVVNRNYLINSGIKLTLGLGSRFRIL